MFGEPSMLIEDLLYFKTSANYSDKYSGLDHPKNVNDIDWFTNYPIQDFDYKYNSWGFRGPEYDQYVGKPVNICLGDSFTVNLGGPIEYSWPSLLQEKFDIPCLNLGMDGAGNDAIRLVYDRACEIFDVQKTFVVYSYLHRRLVNSRFKSEPYNYTDNVTYFEYNAIHDAFFNFIPPWCWTHIEYSYISQKIAPYVNNYELSWELDIPRHYVDELQYNNVKGAEWPTYKDFVAGADPHPDVFLDGFGLPVKGFYLNRDGHHLSLEGNQKLADNLYNQTK